MTTVSVQKISYDPFISEYKSKQNNEAVKSFQNRIHNLSLKDFFDIVDFDIVDGHHLDQYCCSKIDKSILVAIGKDCIHLLIAGLKIGQKKQFNNWKIGCFGSIWFDMDAEPYGIDYIRVAFYPNNKIRITCEKASR